MNEHFNPLLVTVLPQERRSRHPYQLAVMLGLILFSSSQLIVGPTNNAIIRELTYDQQAVLNWYCVVAGTIGVFAAICPERVVRVWRWRFDATWYRLWGELSCHALLAFVWASYGVAIVSRTPLSQGLSPLSGLVLVLTGAASWRFCQISMTLWRALRSKQVAVIGAQTAHLPKRRPRE